MKGAGFIVSCRVNNIGAGTFVGACASSTGNNHHNSDIATILTGGSFIFRK